MSVKHLVSNTRLIQARESVDSIVFPGNPPTRGELATRVRAELRRLGSGSEFTTRHVSRLERGETRWPKDDDVRLALRRVLGVSSDEDLGFHNSRRREPVVAPRSSRESGLPVPSRQSHRRDGSCAHVVLVRQLLPEGFFDQPKIQTALDRRDFGAIFRAVRRHTGLNQVELGSVVGFNQGRVSKIESGKRGLHEVNEVVHVANVLGLEPWRLGFGKSARCEACRGTAERE
nr:helix-turn-helix transcriptional regulator [Kibdelosporangium sp. MJ126-NF4]CEL18251.1 Putative arylsulfatase regulatory protein [Kibdelosporangium sp. MJ126-NF4]CTQ90352.1 Putative arylsulfatase regulatory protein [Kibdelosporangium sp. MJ126-NF4]